MNTPILEQTPATINRAPLGLSLEVREHLASLTGGEPVVRYVRGDEKTVWTPTKKLRRCAGSMLITSTWSVEVESEKHVHLAGGIWLDIDASPVKGESIDDAVKALGQTVHKLKALGIPPECCSLFASGGKGFHVFLPVELWMPKGIRDAGLTTAQHWPRICRAFVYENLVTDLTDIGIYSGGKGRLMRQPHVQRGNGLYKVPLRWDEWQGLTLETYRQMCSAPRPDIAPAPAQSVAPRAAAAWLQALKTVCKPAAPQRRPVTPQVGPDGRLLPRVRKEVVQALCKLVDVSYADWIRVGMALKSTGAGEALQLWEAWSRHHPTYKPTDCASRWPGLSSNTVTLGTLFHLAKGVRA